MDFGKQNQFASREDVNLMKNQLNQLVEAIIALLNRGDNVQQTAVTENVIPPPMNDQAQPQHI